MLQGTISLFIIMISSFIIAFSFNSMTDKQHGSLSKSAACLLTCWKSIDLTSTGMDMKHISSLNQGTILKIIDAEQGWLSQSSFLDRFPKTCFFEEDGLCHQLKNVQNSDVTKWLAQYFCLTSLAQYFCLTSKPESQHTLHKLPPYQYRCVCSFLSQTLIHISISSCIMFPSTLICTCKHNYIYVPIAFLHLCQSVVVCVSSISFVYCQLLPLLHLRMYRVISMLKYTYVHIHPHPFTSSACLYLDV